MRRQLVKKVIFIALVALAVVIPEQAAAHSVAVGGQHACAITPSGGIQCWGGNEFGQLGNGTEPPSGNRGEQTDSNTPTTVVGISGGATDIAAGTEHTCAVVSGAAKCWGDDQWNQLGDGSLTPSPLPKQVVGLESGVTSISAGYFNTCAVQNGLVKCWGTNNYGNVFNGFPNVAGSGVPVDVPGTQGATSVAVSTWHACAIVSGSAKCWGDNGGFAGSPLGAGVNSDAHVLNQVTGMDSGVTAITPVCAVQTSAARCWATYLWGPSVGAKPDGLDLATTVPGLESGVSVVTVGSSGVFCAIVNGGAQCAGDNDDGRLGDGSAVDFSPTLVTPTGLSSGVLDISAGQDAACARSNGKVFCWGSNRRGQLGNGTNTISSVPVEVGVEQSGGTPDPDPPATTYPPPSTPTQTGSRCSRIQVVGLRGIAEKQSTNGGFGSTVNKFRDSFRSAVSSKFRARISNTGLKYDAKPDSLTNFSWDTYRSSLKTGRTALRKILNESKSDDCFVLAGYSQGAHVVGDVLADTNLLSSAARGRILVAVLIADTRFNPDDKTIKLYGSFDSKKKGRMNPRSPGSMTKPNIPYRPYVVMSACNKYDYFCQYLGTANLKTAFDVHGNYGSMADQLGTKAGKTVNSALAN